MTIRGAVVAGVLFAWGAAPTTALAAADLGPIVVTMKDAGGGARLLEGRFLVNAPVELVIATLADYENLPSFVSSVKSSRVVMRNNQVSLVDQVMTGKVGIFRKKILLRLEVFQTPTSISFRDVLKRSFHSYQGSWGVLEQDKAVEVVYELSAAPAFYSPAFIADDAFRHAVEKLLAEVRDEIVAREAASRT